MNVAQNPKYQWTQIVEDYLHLVEHCLAQRRADGSIPNGYSVGLLLLCAIDAIGHGLLSYKKNKTCRFDILVEPPFSFSLSCGQIKNLTEFFRNGLAHAGVMAPDVYLTPDMQGLPFDFDLNGVLVLIRLPVLFHAVKAVWKARDPDVFNSQLRYSKTADKIIHKGEVLSALTPTASGATK